MFVARPGALLRVEHLRLMKFANNVFNNIDNRVAYIDGINSDILELPYASGNLA
jgi:hypothetical protein